ncbi:MAG TPA: thiamine phosphate synthase [Gemmatimonadetes bacterium]|nr:thiamine phosphate synthase [Gemmatimonadota bacterium]
MDFGAWRDSRPTLRVIPRLHVVTDDQVLARPDFATSAREVCEALETRDAALHIRGPHTSGRTLTRLARILREPAAACGVTLLVNDRLDVALAVEASGVHLGSRSIPPTEARRLLGGGRLLGVSVHSESEAVEATRSGADYLFFGPLFETPSHPGAAASGAEVVDRVLSRVDLPVVGIGGVTPQRAATVIASGAHGVAAIRGIWDTPSPREAVQVYLDAVERAIQEKRNE